MFLKSFIKKPFKNITLFLKLINFVAFLLLNRFFSLLKIDLSTLKKIKLFYLISLLSRAKYLKWKYFSSSLINNCEADKNWYFNLPTIGFNTITNSNHIHNIYNIKLASKKISFLKNNIIWDRTYNDPEDTMALHRFGWLLELLVNEKNNVDKKILLDWIEDWIKFQDKNKISIAWESYSVSERIVNWILFFCVIKSHIDIDQKLSLKIRDQFFYHLKYLALNLEFRGHKTNNHIINNARALYIGGQLLGIEFAKKIGKSIIINETDRLLSDGVLNEGSTHYQFLVTRNYLEIFWVAHKTRDDKLVFWLKDRLKNMLNICNYFMIEDNEELSIPFIGDISPDSDPDWLIGYPFNSSKKKFSKWSKLWGDFVEFDELIINFISSSNKNDSASFKKHQWLKIQNSKSITFSMVKNSSVRSHIHQDDGSFYHIYKKTPIIIDPGLKNYLKDDLISRNQISANSHNVITINGCGLIPPRTSWMSRTNMGSQTKFSLNENAIKLKMKGFNCLGHSIRWDRKIDINNNLLEVYDEVNSISGDLIKVIYILNNNLEYIKNKNGFFIKLKKEKLNFEIKRIDKNNNRINNGTYEICDSYLSQNYGKTSKCKTITYSFNAAGPEKIFTCLSNL